MKNSKQSNKNKATGKNSLLSGFLNFLGNTKVALPLVSALIVGGIGTYVWQSSQAATACVNNQYAVGSKGQCVWYVKHLLRQSGASIQIGSVASTEVYTQDTANKVKSFQRANGAKYVDGKVGARETWPKLCAKATDKSRWAAYTLAGCGASYSTSTGSKPSGTVVCVRQQFSQGSSGNCVYALQHLLRQYGMSVATDSSYGSQTKNRVIAFQKAKGLYQDGKVGPKTWGALCSVATDTSSRSAYMIAGCNQR